MTNAVQAWAQQLEFVVVSKDIENFEIQENYITRRVLGTKQPLKAQALTIKPEGQRSWKWYELHLTPQVKINVDDFIRFGCNDQYRVMAKEDFSEYGYVRYEIAQGFTEP
jgi:hypothetical protein